ncbi:MAG: DNA-directed RNA polymerase subunit K [Candidatus Micrarchaeia archaeon]
MVEAEQELTRFEKARLVGARALQLAMGAPPLIELTKGQFEPFEIARLEFEKGVIPITVVR